MEGGNGEACSASDGRASKGVGQEVITALTPATLKAAISDMPDRTSDYGYSEKIP